MQFSVKQKIITVLSLGLLLNPPSEIDDYSLNDVKQDGTHNSVPFGKNEKQSHE